MKVHQLKIVAGESVRVSIRESPSGKWFLMMSPEMIDQQIPLGWRFIEQVLMAMRRRGIAGVLVQDVMSMNQESEETARRSFEEAAECCSLYGLHLVLGHRRQLMTSHYSRFVFWLIAEGLDFLVLDSPSFTLISLIDYIKKGGSRWHQERLDEAVKARRSNNIRAGIARSRVLKKTPIGNPRLGEARPKSIQWFAAKRPEKAVMNKIRLWRSDGLSFRAIAAELNKLGITASRGGKWHAPSVRNLIRRAESG